MEKRNEVWIVWEITPDYEFNTVKYTEEEAKEHCRLRRMHLLGTEMENREVYYKKYVRLE